MNFKLITIKCITAIAAIGILGCESNEEPTTTGQAQVSLSIQGTGKNALLAAKVGALTTQIDIKDDLGVVVGSITLTDARVALKDIELDKPDEVGTDDDSVEFAGPFVVDLISNTVTPSLENAAIPAGQYTQIELQIEKIDSSNNTNGASPLIEESDPLFGNSVYIAGLYTGPTASGNVVDMPFYLSYDLTEEFDLAPPEGAAVPLSLASSLNNVIIAFRLQKWFDFSNIETNSDSLTPSSLTVTNNEIRLDETSLGLNKEIRDVFKDNIKESADFGKDEDGDGELSSDEDDDSPEDDQDDD